MRRAILLVLAALALPAQAADKPRILATVGMIGDVAATVGGECVEVETLMGPGIDPHLYQPSAGDVRAFLKADAIFYGGHNLEGQLGAVLARVGKRVPVVAVSEQAAPVSELIRHEGAGYPDPHVWMDAALWSGTVGPMLEVMARLAPGCAEEMRTRGAAYRLQLKALDGWIRDSIASIPKDRRLLVTAHDAFAYYGRAYGIEVAGIQGVSTESEAGIADIRKVVELVVSRKVPAIFVESTINPRTVKAVIEAAAARDHAVTLGAELYADALGEAGTVGGTYLGMLYENTRHIAGALGGTPAPLPQDLQAWALRWKIGDGS